MEPPVSFCFRKRVETLSEVERVEVVDSEPEMEERPMEFQRDTITKSEWSTSLQYTTICDRIPEAVGITRRLSELAKMLS